MAFERTQASSTRGGGGAHTALPSRCTRCPSSRRRNGCDAGRARAPRKRPHGSQRPSPDGVDLRNRSISRACGTRKEVGALAGYELCEVRVAHPVSPLLCSPPLPGASGYLSPNGGARERRSLALRCRRLKVPDLPDPRQWSPAPYTGYPHGSVRPEDDEDEVPARLMMKSQLGYGRSCSLPWYPSAVVVLSSEGGVALALSGPGRCRARP